MMDPTAPPAGNHEPLRVLRVLTRPNDGGPTQQAIALWHALADRGVRTLLVTGSVQAGEATRAPAAHGVPAVALADVLAGADVAGWLELSALGRRLSPWADWRASRLLRACMAAWRPDVVHTHTSKAGWLGRRAARRANVPVVAHTFHGHVLRDYFPAPVGAALAWLERRLARRTDLLVAVSASCADELAAAQVAPRAAFHIVPPAVPQVSAAERAAARAELGIAATARRVAFVGRLVPIKRPLDFVAAVQRVPGLGGDVFGDGPLRRAVAGAAAAGDVRMLGSRPDAARWLAAYDALVLPSRREGLPLVAVEAARAGVALVGYDVPGVADAALALGGELAPRDGGPAALAAAIARAIGRRSAMPSADPFAPAAVAAELHRLYALALHSARRRSVDTRVPTEPTP